MVKLHRAARRPDLAGLRNVLIFILILWIVAFAIGINAAFAADDDETASQVAAHRLYADAAPPPVSDHELTQPPATSVVVAPAPAPAAPVPVQNADGSWNLQPLLDGFIKFVGGVLGLVGAWLLSKLSDPLAKYIGIHVDAKEVAKDIGLEDQATNAVRNIIGIVEQRTGWTPEALKNVELKNVFLQMGAALLFKQYPEIWNWLENQKGNALEWMESKLDGAAKSAPLTIDQAKALLAGAPAIAAKPATG